MDEELDLTLLECASVKRQKHFLIKPLVLGCGHYMCFNCVEKEKGEETHVRCGFCQSYDFVYLNDTRASSMVNFVIKAYIQRLFDVVNDKCNLALNEMKNLFCGKKQKVEIEYRNLKEEIETRAESLKNEIDELCKKICKDLDAKKKLDIKKIESLHSNFLVCKKEIEESKNLKMISDMNKGIEFLQEKLDYLQDLRKDFDETVAVTDSDISLNLENFGNFYYPDDKKSKNVTIRNFSKKIDLNIHAYGLCVLSKNRLIVTDRQSDMVCLYNNKFERKGKILRINKQAFVPYAITTNGTDRIYITDYGNKQILMTDFDFELLNTYDLRELENPSALCFANNLLYVCDVDHKCIRLLKPDLTYESSFPVYIEPWGIQVIDNMACIRHYNKPCIRFYKLPEFSLKYSYDNHNGSICAVNSKFYEFYKPTSTIYCYNKDGTICKKEKIQLRDDTNIDEYSEIVYFKNKFIISSNTSKCLIFPYREDDNDDDDDGGNDDDDNLYYNYDEYDYDQNYNPNDDPEYYQSDDDHGYDYNYGDHGYGYNYGDQNYDDDDVLK